MDKEIKDLFESLVLNRKKCPWAKEQSLEAHFKELELEVQEFKEAMEKDDVENMREEIGDVFLDLIFIGIIAEEKGLFSLRDALKEAHEKIVRRKPWVFGEETITSKEDAVKRWYEIKAIEKAERAKGEKE